MKKIVTIFLSVALIFGVSTSLASKLYEPHSVILKKYHDNCKDVFVQLITVQISPAMRSCDIVIERTDNEVLAIHNVNEAVADVASIVLPVAHGPPRSDYA